MAKTCGKCGATGVRLYRPYGEFLRPERVLCRTCIPTAEADWFVPCVVADDGTVWGYTSAPHVDFARWEALPEATPTAAAR